MGTDVIGKGRHSQKAISQSVTTFPKENEPLNRVLMLFHTSDKRKIRKSFSKLKFLFCRNSKKCDNKYKESTHPLARTIRFVQRPDLKALFILIAVLIETFPISIS